MNYEAWNRYVLGAVGFVGVLMYASLLYVGFVDLKARFPTTNGKRTRKQLENRNARNGKMLHKDKSRDRRLRPRGLETEDSSR